MEEKYGEFGTQLLKTPVSFGELIDTGAQFEVDLSSAKDEFNMMDIDDSDDDNELDVNNEELVSPWTHSFEELKRLMVPLTEHIHKRITRKGEKELGLVPDKARVAVRYSAYWEGEGAPFDSSLLRGTKYEFETGQHMVIEGLEAAVRTMYPFEQAEFIISYHLLFRDLGCPPRIKPKADGLFKIEVVNFTLVGDREAFEKLHPEDQNKFHIVYPKALDMHLHGKDCVKRHKYQSAITAFEKAISSLNYCRLADDNDETKQTTLLITLYQNLMVCYNKLNRPQRVCIMMKALNRITKENPSGKSLYHHGRALAALGEYDRARADFLRAQEKHPNNKEISDEILKLDKRITNYNQSSRNIWTRAFGIETKETNTNSLSSDDEDVDEHHRKFKTECDAMIKQFAETSIESLGLSRNSYTAKEFQILLKLAKKNNMALNASRLNEDVITLAKLKIN
ncbi:inactive peptidyl-prolyl cis-trans isomerase shutdown [Drosophila tropicalis]|uniref:inactive peptidyl-prolyl cis-trans isomerase shutdown n=1 Tax=Drosophila tropicalis TaxID=46794 RepID=UPI0035ABD6F1